ncbi:hypothetical protein [Streptomyces sp. NPDC091217]|uniref:hypothetical protein n=1 Tax=Streptomyces sp. NPDC091217 TaxID=3365975 RepID=UPI003807A666
MDNNDILPLTWAQKAWQAGPHGDAFDLYWRHDCSMPFRRSVRLDASSVKAAAQQAISRHAVLRSAAVHPSVDEIVQTVLPEDISDDLLFRELDEADVGARGRDVVDVFLRIDKNYGPNLAVALVHGPSGSTLWLKAAHFVLDGAGMAMLARQIMDEGATPEARCSSAQHLEIVAWERGKRAGISSQRGIEKWCEHSRRACETGAASRLADAAMCSVADGSSAPLMRTSAALAGRFGVPQSAILLSLFLVAYGNVSAAGSAWVAICSANRVLPCELDYVGLQTRNGSLFLDFRDDNEHFGSLTRRVAAGLVGATRNARHDPPRLLEEADRHGLPVDPPLFFNTAVFPPPGRAADAVHTVDSESGDFDDLTWREAPQGRYALEMNFHNFGSRVGLTVEHSPQFISRDGVSSVVKALTLAGRFLSGSTESVRLGDIRSALSDSS